MGRFNDDTCFLFSDPSFLTGTASLMDITGSLLIYNSSPSGAEADARAIASDWAVIGSHILKATEDIEQETQDA
jgi:hypothetical protein